MLQRQMLIVYQEVCFDVRLGVKPLRALSRRRMFETDVRCANTYHRRQAIEQYWARTVAIPRVSAQRTAGSRERGESSPPMTSSQPSQRPEDAYLQFGSSSSKVGLPLR